MLRLLRHLRRNRKGTAAVEFALVAPLLIALLGAATDLGLAFSQSVRLSAAVRAGVAYAPTHAADTSFISGVIESSLTGIGPHVTQVNGMECLCLDPVTGAVQGSTPSDVICQGSCPGGYARYVRISVSKSFTPIFPTSNIITFNSISQVRASATVRIH